MPPVQCLQSIIAQLLVKGERNLLDESKKGQSRLTSALTGGDLEVRLDDACVYQSLQHHTKSKEGNKCSRGQW